MSPIQPETGFIGFFDILGYTQIILNNNIHRTAEFVSDTLVNMPGSILNNLLPSEGNTAQKRWEWIGLLEKIEWIIFSDTILLSMPFDPQLENPDLLQHYGAFATVSASLMNRSFLAGFPLRGSISVGEFFIEERCFAGKPIISAYQVSQGLEFSGCVLDAEANNLVSQLRKDIVRRGDQEQLQMMDQTTLMYMVPMKSNSDERHRTINWVSESIPGCNAIGGDVRDATLRAFQMHNKIAIPGVQGKINNTEMFIRHVNTNVESKDWLSNPQYNDDPAEEPAV